MMTFEHAKFHTEPYVIGLATEVMAPALFDECVREYPDERTFVHLQGRYEKFSLSERNNPSDYHAVVQRSPWAALHKYIKSPTFVVDVWRCLDAHGMTLGSGTFRSRFEFSSLPSQGGMLWPHTDIASKVVTLILPMMAPGTWHTTWGGSTDVLVPKPGVIPKDYETPRDAFDCPLAFPCEPNQAVIFIKSAHSWHAVGPLQGPPGHWRRTLTVNIERVG